MAFLEMEENQLFLLQQQISFFQSQTIIHQI